MKEPLPASVMLRSAATKHRTMADLDHRYDDIIGLEHPSSKRHPRMPMKDRAAQFAPFAALTGYDELIDDTVARQQEDW